MKSITRAFVSSGAAAEMVAAALAHARTHHWEVAVAVVDPAGQLVAFGRTDGVIAPAGEFAIDKAYTAGVLGKSTERYFERMAQSDALRTGLANRPRLMVWAGGLALLENGACIGGIGVSGALDHQDVACAEAAIAAAGLAAG